MRGKICRTHNRTLNALARAVRNKKKMKKRKLKHRYLKLLWLYVVKSRAKTIRCFFFFSLVRHLFTFDYLIYIFIIKPLLVAWHALAFDTFGAGRFNRVRVVCLKSAFFSFVVHGLVNIFRIMKGCIFLGTGKSKLAQKVNIHKINDTCLRAYGA